MHNRTMETAAATIAALFAWVLFRGRRQRRRRGRTYIVSPRNSTRVAADGAVHSLQSAHIELPRAELDRLWAPAQLENLGRTYWRFLSRATLGAIRVIYGEHERVVVLLARPLRLLRFEAPTYTLEPDHANINWAIRDGLLVSPSGRGCGFLAVTVRRDTDRGEPAKVDVDVEVANFYPAIASGLGTNFYRATQSFVHVLLTHAFLRSLDTLELAESKVGRLRQHD